VLTISPPALVALGSFVAGACRTLTMPRSRAFSVYASAVRLALCSACGDFGEGGRWNHGRVPSASVMRTL
jgi:hypothetical protein